MNYDKKTKKELIVIIENLIKEKEESKTEDKEVKVKPNKIVNN